MAITAISRNFDGDPNIVTIIATDNLATITTAGYVTSQESAIQALQNGEFQWADTDLVLMYYSPAQVGFFTYNASTQAFVVLADNGNLSNTLTSGHIFVGNGSNIATDRAVSGAITINNTGGVSLSNDIVGFDNLKTYVSKLATVSLSAAEVKAMYDTPKLLIAAPGVGFITLIQNIYFDVFYGAPQYTGGGTVAAQYGNAIHGAGPKASNTIDNDTINGINADYSLFIGGGAGALVAPSASVENTAIYLSNNTAPFADGESGMVLYIVYRISDA